MAVEKSEGQWVTLSMLCHRVPSCTNVGMTENHGVGGSIPPLGTKILRFQGLSFPNLAKTPTEL